MFEEIEKIAEKREEARENNMFDEMEKIAEKGEETIKDVNKLFHIDDISNQEIGSKIKSFTKFFLKLQIVIYAIAMIAMLIFVISSGGEEEAIIAFLISIAVIAIAFIGAYYVFLILSGFGALVEDVNALKANEKKNESTKSKK